MKYLLTILLSVLASFNSYGQMRKSEMAGILNEYGKQLGDYVVSGDKLPVKLFSNDKAYKANYRKSLDVHKLYKKYKNQMSFVGHYSGEYFDQVWIDSSGTEPVILFKVVYNTSWEGEQPKLDNITLVPVGEIKNLEAIKDIAWMWMPNTPPPPIVELK